MKHSDQTPAVGLDVGTSRIVAASQHNGEFQFKSQLNAFVEVPWSKMTEASLKREGVPFVVHGEASDKNIIVPGNESSRFSDLLQVEARRPMSRGVLNPSEPENAVMLKQLIENLIADNRRKGLPIFYSVPSAPLGAEENVTYHDATINQIIRELDCEPTPISEGLAVVFSELEETNYSGIGISFGGGLVNVCLSYLAVPVLSFSVAKAGDYIDSSAAAITGELATRIRLAKEESFQINGNQSDKLHQVLNVYYDEMMRAVVNGLREAFANARSMPKIGRPVPMVLSGGSSMPKGFRDRFEKLLKESEFPLPLSEIRMAENPLNSTAKGALVAALAEL
jgi:actin-like ATPase involved in cell morphogenesis